jgi:hypothetical protein
LIINDLRKTPPKSNNNSNNNPVFLRVVRRRENRLFLLDRPPFPEPAQSNKMIGSPRREPYEFAQFLPTQSISDRHAERYSSRDQDGGIMSKGDPTQSRLKISFPGDIVSKAMGTFSYARKE